MNLQVTMHYRPGDSGFVRTHSRRNGPQTSQKAAGRAETFAGGHCGRILAVYASVTTGAALTASEIALMSGLTVVQVCRRLPDLQAANKLQPTGEESGGFRKWALVTPSHPEPTPPN